MPVKDTISILIVDDNNTIRSTLKMVLERQKLFRVVAHTSNGRQGIELYQVYKPDIVLTDIVMKTFNDLDMCQKIIEIDPLACVVVLSGIIVEDEMLISALNAGISGYLTKNVSKLLIDNKFYQDIDVKEDLLKIYKDLKEKVYSLNPTLKKLYTLLYSNQKKFSE